MAAPVYPHESAPEGILSDSIALVPVAVFSLIKRTK